jgi:hypothetical protein
MTDKKVAEIANKWHKRYWYDIAINHLQASKMIKILGYGRHTFASASVFDDDDFLGEVKRKYEKVANAAKARKAKEAQRRLLEKLRQL